jgi:hypothetical protein
LRSRVRGDLPTCVSASDDISKGEREEGREKRGQASLDEDRKTEMQGCMDRVHIGSIRMVLSNSWVFLIDGGRERTCWGGGGRKKWIKRRVLSRGRSSRIPFLDS